MAKLVSLAIKENNFDDDELVFIVGVRLATAHVPTPWHYTTYMCSSRSVAMVMVWSVMVGRCSGDVWFRLVA